MNKKWNDYMTTGAQSKYFYANIYLNIAVINTYRRINIKRKKVI